MRLLAVVLVFSVVFSPSAVDAKEGDGFVALFDGKTLEGWSGDPKFWSIQDDAITGVTTESNATKGNTFCVLEKEVEGDFELQFDFRIEGHNSGVQYRAFRLEDAADEWRIGGYQADFDAAKKWAGTLYSEKSRGILAARGEKTILTGTTKNKKGRKVVKREVEKLGDAAALAEKINDFPKWNTFRVVAKGYHMQHFINDTLMIDCMDKDEANRRNRGLIALQLHQGPPMKVQFKNIKIKVLQK